MSSGSTSGSFTYIRGTILANGSTAPPSTPVDDVTPIHGLANPTGLEAGFAAHSIPPDVNLTNAAGSTTTRPLMADETDNDALWLEVMSFERKLKVKHDKLTAIFALYHRISDHPAEMRIAAEDTLVPYTIRSYIRLLERELALTVASAYDSELTTPTYAAIVVSSIARNWPSPAEKAQLLRGKLSLLPCIAMAMETGRTAAAEFGEVSANFERMQRAEQQAQQARQQQDFDYQDEEVRLIGIGSGIGGSAKGSEKGYEGDEDVDGDDYDNSDLIDLSD